MSLNDRELMRYSRQIGMPEIGREGQEMLKGARVFLAGLGGLGSVSAQYLVAAGVGHVTAVDTDRVNLHNLNRQILYCTKDIGKPKAGVAAEKLRALNPECDLLVIDAHITDDNAARLVGDCQIIVDAMDNFGTRKILNRVAIEKGVPFVVGGVDGLNGMVLTIKPGDTACLECIFPGVEGDRQVSVLGATPGVVASLQVIEVVKLIIGFGRVLSGRLLVIQGRDMTFREIAIDRNPGCAVCGNGGGKG